MRNSNSPDQQSKADLTAAVMLDRKARAAFKDPSSDLSCGTNALARASAALMKGTGMFSGRVTSAQPSGEQP